MRFLWHHALWLSLALPALAGVYLLLLRGRQPWRAHLPAALLFLGVAALLLAVARPVVVVTTPSQEGTVVLLIDVSLSMAASDVEPTRLAAARAAALAFAKAQPRDVRIAVVAFGGHADLVQPPTLDRNEVIAALDRLELQRFTAIGNGLMAAILTLDPTAQIGEEYDIFGSGRIPEGMRMSAGGARPKPVAAGSYLSSAIILVSDGRGTMGIPPAKAAKMAADLGIRVYTIGVGTLYGGVATVDGWPTIHAEFDEDILTNIAAITRGEYFLARTGDKVAKIYESLGRRIIFERREIEITVPFIAAGVLLTLAAAALSLLWTSRPTLK